MAVDLVLVLHNHQPVGNFGHVFARAYEQCYRPLLDRLAAHPRVKVALHHTGPLLEWMESERKSYLDDLRSLAERGQVELVGGGFYEPMLAVLPDRDARGQIKMMADFCQRRLGARPQGMWLAERVWDPDLPRVIAPTGMRYTLLDDSHFFAAGLTGRLSGHYVTEKAGSPLAIFPIDQALRYAIPFQDVDAAMAELKTAGEGRELALTYGDDGEKFGLWPGTNDWVFGKGWLDRFLTRIEESGDWLTTRHPSEMLSRPAQGRVYLPTASYAEMGEWSLPAASTRIYESLVHELQDRRTYEQYKPFVRGGIWQGFLAKYPEADSMHKRMLQVSDAVEAAAEAAPSGGQNPLLDAKRELYRGQCNCAYWHGLFGGLYLNYLRHGVYSSLIRADAQAARARHGEEFLLATRADVDRDLSDESVLENARLWACIDPASGGSVLEIDHRPSAFNLSNVLGRNDEAFHDKVRAIDAKGDHGGGANDSPSTIHGEAKAKEKGLSRLLAIDGYRRGSFLERFYTAGTGPGESGGNENDLAGFAAARWALGPVQLTSAGAQATLSRTSATFGGRSLRVEKTFTLQRAGAHLEAAYTVTNGGVEPIDGTFAVEFNLSLLAGDDAERFYELPGGVRARLNTRGQSDGNTLVLADCWSKLRVLLTSERARIFWRYPIETVSQSEEGFERTWQGSCVLLGIPLKLAPGAAEQFSVLLDVSTWEPAERDRA